MDLRRLEVFGKLMETRSFSKTANELNLTQPTVSGHIKTLEEQIGLSLFDRHKRLVRPTSAAVILYEYALKLLDIHKQAVYALEKFHGRIGGELRIGGSTIPGTYILPSAITRFHNIYPETKLALSLGDTREIVEMVAQRQVELAMIGSKAGREDLVCEPIMDDDLVMAAPTTAGFAPELESVNAITHKALAKIPFILREEGSATRQTLEDALAVQGMSVKDLNVVAELGSTEAVRQAIRAGLAASILSRVAVIDDVHANMIKIIKLKGLNLRRKFYLVTHAKSMRSPVCDAFLDFLRNEVKVPTT